MANLKILVWQNAKATGEPEVEVKVPAGLAKWVPRLMKFVPRKTKEETWGQDVDFDGLVADVQKLGWHRFGLQLCLYCVLVLFREEPTDHHAQDGLPEWKAVRSLSTNSTRQSQIGPLLSCKRGRR